MATATQVTIKVVIDGKDAGPAIDGINQKLGEIGVKGSASVQQAGHAIDQLGGHVATQLDSVRLLSQEFGLRLPRAIEAMLSRMPAVTSAISGMLGGLAAIAALQVFARIGEDMYRAFDLGGERARAMAAAVQDVALDMRRLNNELDVQLDKLQQEQARLEHRPFNTMKLDIDEAAQAADQLASKLNEINTKFAKQVVEQMAGSLPQRMLFLQSGTGAEQTMLGEHQKWLTLAPNMQAQLGEEGSYGKQLQERLKNLQQQQASQPMALGGLQRVGDYSKEIGAVQAMIKQQATETTAIQKSIDLNKTQTVVNKEKEDKTGAGGGADKSREEAINTIARLQREADEASLRDDALLTQKRLDEIAEVESRLKELHATSAQLSAAEAAINKKYDGEREVRLARQIEDAQKAVRDASMAGLTGALKIQAERQAHDADIDARQDLSPEAKQIQHQAVQITYSQQMGAYWQENDEKEGGDAETKAKQVQANQQEDLRYAQQAAEAERKVKRQGLQGWVSDYQSTIAEIQAQEVQRLHQVDDDAKKEDLLYAEVQQRKASVTEQANAEIAAQQQQMQHQIAGELQSAFTDPLGFIKQKMEQMFFETIAAWLMQLDMFKKMFGSTMGGLSIGGGKQGSGLMGGLFGGGGNAAAAGSRPTFGGHPSQSSGAGIDDGGTAAPLRAEIASAGAGIATASASHGGFGPAIGDSGSVGGTVVSGLSDANSIAGMIRPRTVAGQAQQGSLGPGTLSNLQGLASDMNFKAGGDGQVPLKPDGTVDISKMPGESSSGITGLSGMGGSMPFSGDSAGTSSGAGAAQGGASGAVSTATGLATVGFAGYEGYSATKQAYMSDSIGGTFKGAAQDAMVGAGIGMMVGGPVGALIGAGIGAAVGLTAGIAGLITGQGKRDAARDYYKQTLFPEMEQERNGQTDASTGISQVNKIASDGMSYMLIHWGSDAAKWVNDNYLKKEQDLADAQILQRAKGGGYAVGMSAQQFHTGGLISGFGDFGTTANEGYIHAQLNEAVMNRSAVAMHGPALDAMNRGASSADVAKMYLASTPQPSSYGVAAGGDTHNYNISAIDAKGFDSFLKRGGARQIVKRTNGYYGQYAGDGISG